MTKLMHSHHTRQYNKIAYGNMPSQCTVIRKNAIVSHNAVVRNVAIRLDETILSNNGLPFILRTAVHRHTLPNGGVITDLCSGFFAIELQVLWDARDNGSRENPTVLTDTGAIHDGHVRANPSAFFDDHVLVDGHKRLNHYVPRNLGLWMYIC